MRRKWHNRNQLEPDGVDLMNSVITAITRQRNIEIAAFQARQSHHLAAQQDKRIRFQGLLEYLGKDLDDHILKKVRAGHHTCRIWISYHYRSSKRAYDETTAHVLTVVINGFLDRDENNWQQRGYENEFKSFIGRRYKDEISVRSIFTETQAEILLVWGSEMTAEEADGY